MRWIVHWKVGQAALHGRRSLAYQLGCVMPDWFEIRPIHRWKETGKKFLDRAVLVRRMKPGFRRDWLLGTLAHYACDYCTTAHQEEYYRFYRHRVYEVMAQRYFLRRSRKKPNWFVSGPAGVPEALRDPRVSDRAFREALSAWIASHIDALKERISERVSDAWYEDEKTAELDIRESYLLLSELTGIFDKDGKRT